MFYVIENYTGEILFTSTNKEDCEKFCGKVAADENYGICRSWTIGDCLYMDCGRKVFVITDNLSGLNRQNQI